MQKPQPARMEWLIEHALAEDIRDGDITSRSVDFNIPDCRAKIVSKAAGCLAGIDVAAQVFRQHDDGINIEIHKQDGEQISSGETLLDLRGPGRSILEAERVALNLLGRCSGIATMTAAYVAAVGDYPARILDTRKTVPLLRDLDKYAVRAGGGHNHRYGLFDMILIKENHVRFAGSLEKAIQAAIDYLDQNNLKVNIEVEVTNFDELRRAAHYPVQRIMLDNFSDADMHRAVREIDGKIKLEASGGITLERIPSVAATGVDYISVGALTHSVRNFDLSLLFEHSAAGTPA